MNINQKQKKKSKAGYTLAELLIVIIIMVLMTGVATLAIQLSSSEFFASVRQSESKVLLSTLTEAISNELRYEDSDSHSVSSSSGRVLLDGKAVLPDKAYVYGLTAAASSSYDSANGKYNITITISNSGTELCSSEFSVKPLNL